MSLELLGAMEQLVQVLRRHFTPTGNPPRLQPWCCPIEFAPEDRGDRARKEHKRRFGALEMEVPNSFSHLTNPSPHWLVVEALQSIKPLPEIKTSLVEVERALRKASKDPATARCQLLFSRLLNCSWFLEDSVSLDVDDKTISWCYEFAPMDEQLLTDLTDAARATFPKEIEPIPSRSSSRYVTRKDICKLCRVSGRTLKRRMDEGAIPPPDRAKSGKSPELWDYWKVIPALESSFGLGLPNDLESLERALKAD